MRLLYNAMPVKADPVIPLQGRPKMIYLDNGPVMSNIRVFQHVMLALDITF